MEAERNHELLLSVKNLRELGTIPFCYIVLVIPHSLPEELFKREHLVLTDPLKSISASSLQVGSVKEPQAEIAEGALVSFIKPYQSPLVVQDPKPAPWSAKKKGKTKAAQVAQKKKKGKIIVASAGLEGFVNWVDTNASDPT